MIMLPISVIIPAYNRADLLPRALNSVAMQTAQPAEVIVVDDCSSDATGAVAGEWGATVLTHERNRGGGEARNTAIRATRREWLALLDSDDEWLPGHLERLWARRGQHVLLSGSAMSKGAPGGQRLLGPTSNRPTIVTHPTQLLFPVNPIPASGVLVRRDTVLDAGAFRPMAQAEDLDLWLRVIERGTALLNPELSYYYYMHPGQVSQDRTLMRRRLLALVDDYVDRRWYSDDLKSRMEVALRWDELHEHRRAGRYADARRSAGWLLSSRSRAAAAAQMAKHRVALRLRERQVATPDA